MSYNDILIERKSSKELQNKILSKNFFFVLTVSLGDTSRNFHGRNSTILHCKGHSVWMIQMFETFIPVESFHQSYQEILGKNLQEVVR